MSIDQLSIDGLLILPHLRIQNANAISSPLTWGFPSMTAFTGLMHALERRFNEAMPIGLQGVGVICHRFEAQATAGGYTRAFRLTRNPVDKTGATAAIVEEGRIHLEVTLVFGMVRLEGFPNNDVAAQALLAQSVGEVLACMRVAGGSIVPALAGHAAARGSAQLVLLGDDPVERDKLFRRARRRWLPGFALVSRDDLLRQRLAELRALQPDASALDAWLDLSRLNHRAQRNTVPDPKTGAVDESIEWVTQRSPGWIVPIPVGYGALSDLHAAGTVVNARDATTQFRFVESLYSMGQWISPHRLRNANELLWYAQHDPGSGLYRCCNDFRPPTSSALASAAPAPII